MEIEESNKNHESNSFFVSTGLGVFSILSNFRCLFCFMLIVLGVYFKKRKKSTKVIYPLIVREIYKCGLIPLPIILFLSFVIGFLVVGQTIPLSELVGSEIIGNILVLVIFKEVGPLLAATVVLIRIGISTVVELAEERASKNLDGIVSLGIDPIYYYVIPRVLGMGCATFCLTIYLIIFAFLSGYIVVFFMDIPWKPIEYVDQIVAALLWSDFLLLALKTMFFGGLVAVATSYEALTRPLRSQDIPKAITRTVIDCLLGWGIIDIIFLLL